MTLVIKNGRVVDPTQGLDEVLDIRVQDGVIVEVGHDLSADETLEAKGRVVTPGLIDMHVHLREPGLEYKETISTGTRAAAKGGFTAVACMPNTVPVNDCAAVTAQILAIAAQEGVVRVYPIGAVTRGSKGAELTEMAELRRSGCVAVSDDGKPVESANKMQLAMEYASAFGLTVHSHCEDLDLVQGGDMNEGPVCTRLGLRPNTPVAEELMAAREILLARSLGVRVHLCHISTRGSVELVRWAKGLGVQVSCETCPHYICGTDDLVEGYDTNTRVNPPLRSQDDRQAILEGLMDGTIDAIATDHAPHHADEKLVEYQLAANGISGLESAFGLCYTELVSSGRMTLSDLVERMSVHPASLLGVPGGSLQVGQPADITVWDLETTYAIDPAHFVSKGHNNPFGGWKVQGRAIHTVVGGKPVLVEGQLAE